MPGWGECRGGIHHWQQCPTYYLTQNSALRREVLPVDNREKLFVSDLQHIQHQKETAACQSNIPFPFFITQRKQSKILVSVCTAFYCALRWADTVIQVNDLLQWKAVHAYPQGMAFVAGVILM